MKDQYIVKVFRNTETFTNLNARHLLAKRWQ